MSQSYYPQQSSDSNMKMVGVFIAIIIIIIIIYGISNFSVSDLIGGIFDGVVDNIGKTIDSIGGLVGLDNKPTKNKNKLNLTDIDSATFPWIMASYDSAGEVNYYEIPDNGKLWLEVKFGKNKNELNDDRFTYSGGTNNPTFSPDYFGAEFKSNSLIFQNTSSSDADNTYKASGGKNISTKVYSMEPPNDKYIKEDKYLYKEQHGTDYVFAVFKRKENNYEDDYMSEYIMMNVHGDGSKQRYTIPTEEWENIRNNIDNNNHLRNFNYDGGTNNPDDKLEYFGILLDPKSTIFENTTTYNITNSYSIDSDMKNNANAVYALEPPTGYIKENKYVYWPTDFGANYVYAVFAKISKDCKKYTNTDVNIDDKCMDILWKNAGCTTDVTKAQHYSGWGERNMPWLKGDFSQYAIGTEDRHKIDCYGSVGAAPKTGSTDSTDSTDSSWMDTVANFFGL